MASILSLRDGARFRASICVNRKRITKVFKTEQAARDWAEKTEWAEKKSVTYDKATAERLLSMVPRRVLDALAKVSLSHDGIASNALPVPVMSGVYFLLNGGVITYVGQSVNVFDRIGRHARDGRRFDAFNWISCEGERMDVLEEAYITTLMPSENVQVSTPSGRYDLARRKMLATRKAASKNPRVPTTEYTTGGQ